MLGAVAAIAALVSIGPSPTAPTTHGTLEAPVRVVAQYLDALLAAAPAPPVHAGRGARRRRDPDDPRWTRLRALIAPAGEVGANATDRARLLDPSEELGLDGALVGYRLVSARRDAERSAIVVAAERVTSSSEAGARSRTCAYLAVENAGRWLLAGKRCASEREAPAPEAAPGDSSTRRRTG